MFTPKNQPSFFSQAYSYPDIGKKAAAELSETLSMSIGTNGLHPAVAAYFKHQRLISWSSSVQALGLVERALVVEHRPTKVELSRPVHRPVPSQVVLLLHWADSQVAGGNLHFLHMNALCPSWNKDHCVIFFTRQKRREYPCRKSMKRSPSTVQKKKLNYCALNALALNAECLAD